MGNSTLLSDLPISNSSSPQSSPTADTPPLSTTDDGVSSPEPFDVVAVELGYNTAKDSNDEVFVEEESLLKLQTANSLGEALHAATDGDRSAISEHLEASGDTPRPKNDRGTTINDVLDDDADNEHRSVARPENPWGESTESIEENPNDPQQPGAWEGEQLSLNETAYEAYGNEPVLEETQWGQPTTYPEISGAVEKCSDAVCGMPDEENDTKQGSASAPYTSGDEPLSPPVERDSSPRVVEGPSCTSLPGPEDLGTITYLDESIAPSEEPSGQVIDPRLGSYLLVGGDSAKSQHWSQYADPSADLRIPFCKFHAQAQCTQGDACKFRHSLSPNEFALLFHETQPQLSALLLREISTAAVSKACMFYPLGKCRNGDTCPYLHIPSFMPPHQEEQQHKLPSEAGSELRQKPCTYYMKGQCNRGVQCYYSHDVEVAQPSSGNGDGTREPGSHTHEGDRSQRHEQRKGAQDARPCKWFQRGGFCRQGDQCHFLHDSWRVEGDEASGGYKTPNTFFPGQDDELDDRRDTDDGGWGSYQDGWGTTTEEPSTSISKLETPVDDKGVQNDASWGNYVDEWGQANSSQETDQEQPLPGGTAQNDTVDDGWNPNASGWGNYDEQPTHENEGASPNSSRHSDEKQSDAQTEWEPENLPPQSQCKEFIQNRCRRGDRCRFSHDIPKERAASDCSTGQQQGWGKLGSDCDPCATTKNPCPFHAKGYCKKGTQCNLSHDTPNTTPRGETPHDRRATPKKQTPSQTPVRPGSVEPAHTPILQQDQPLTTAIIAGDHWQAPDYTSDTEEHTLQAAADAWPDSESEDGHAPWSVPKRPICDFFLQGRCKKGKCANRHETPSNIQNTMEASMTVKTVERATQSESDSPVIEQPPVESPKCAVEISHEDSKAGEMEIQMHSSPDDEDHAAESKSPNYDENTWSADWPQPEPLPLSKIQAPCKAFGQGHCPNGDDCLYQHIVDVTAGLEALPSIASPQPIDSESVQSEETERDICREGSPDEAPTRDIANEAEEEQGEIVVERTLFNCIVRFGLDNGCSPTEIVTASDTSHAIISNLPPDISHTEAMELVESVDEEKGFAGVDFERHETKTDVIARFSAPHQADNAVTKLDGQVYDSRLLTAWRDGETIQPSLECRTVKIKWPAPSRSVWFYYPTVTLAKKHEKRLNDQVVDGRTIKAEFSRPRPKDPFYAVKISGFHIHTDEKEIEMLALETKMTHKIAPTYLECPLDNVRNTLAAKGSLEQFFRIPLDPKSAKHTAFARFEDGVDRVLEVHGKAQAYIAKESLKLQKVFHANYKISKRRYQAVHGVLEWLREEAGRHQCTLDVYDGPEEPVDIHLYADATADTCATFGATNRALYCSLQGEVMQEVMPTSDDYPTVCTPTWDGYFEMPDSASRLERINTDTSFFVKVDTRRQVVRILGDENGRERARNKVLKLLEMVRAQRHVVRLDLRGIRVLVDGGYAKLQEELGANKVTLDLAAPELVVFGDASSVNKATAAVAGGASPEADSAADHRSLDTEECCFMCKRIPREPVKLSCIHVYCTACLQHVLLPAAGAHFAPPRCLAGCEEYVPYTVVRDALPMAEEAALMRNAFLAYVRGVGEDEYLFCPQPHCETVFRRLAEGRMGAVCYKCVSCGTKICARCREEYHEGTDCTA
ncbi:hypothetical protein DXG01_012336 [Tephrocybe rancida]|nr:hypothetical protein DXG01_012336 [Tephrocybe rancida]